jgi:hypothetical protein
LRKLLEGVYAREHVAGGDAGLETVGKFELRKEIKVNTDKNGLAEFPRLEAYKLTISVTAKAYRSYWRWKTLSVGAHQI